MENQHYHIVVVGAGPAGLSAARTAARLGFRTLVLERLTGPGDVSHPCAAVVAPVHGDVSGQRAGDGIRFPEIDLLVPRSLILGAAPVQRFLSPGGQKFEAVLPGRDDFPLAVIDKAGLLRQLAAEAENAGVEIRYGVAAIGLTQTGSQVTGVRTGDGDIRADLVLAAEGAPGQLCEEAGLYTATSPAKRYALIVGQELEAPAVGKEHLGQIVTLGRRYTSARHAFGNVLLPAPGRACVYFTMITDNPHHTERSLWFYLDEYLKLDPRVAGLFAGSRVVGGSGQRLALREAPRQIVCDGLMGIGDAVTPGGQLGIVSAVYSGRQAALVAADALDAGDVSAAHLHTYQQLCLSSIRTLESERKLMLGLTELADEEIDHLCQTLSSLAPVTPFFSTWRPAVWDTIGWLAKQYPLLARDWDLLERALEGSGGLWTPPEPAALPVGARPAPVELLH